MLRTHWPPKNRDYLDFALRMGRACIYDLEREAPLIKNMGRLEKLAWKRFYTDVVNPPKGAEWYFDPEPAIDAINLLQQLPLPDGTYGGKFFRLDPWQILVCLCRYGFWENVRWGHSGRVIRAPRFNNMYIEIARGNGKTTFIGGLKLVDTIIFDYDGGDFIIAATTQRQAGLTFRKMRTIIKRSHVLLNAPIGYNIRNKEEIYIETKNAQVFAASSDADTLDGLAAVSATLDELHAHKTGDLYDVINSSKGKHPVNLITMITTGGRNMDGPCYKERGMAESILEGALDRDRYFALICTVDKGDKENWDDLNVIKKANPGYDSLPLLQREIKDDAAAAHLNTRTKNDFWVKRLNIWLQSLERWLEAGDVARTAAPGKRTGYFKKMPVWIGVDLSEHDDLSAVAFGFEDKTISAEKTPLHFFTRIYGPREGIKEKIRDGNLDQYQEWMDKKHITITDGDNIDWRKIESDIIRIARHYPLGGIVLDQMSGAQYMVSSLRSRFGEKKVHILPKTSKNISPVAHDFEARLKASRRRAERNLPQLFTYDGNPAVAWHMTNAVVDRRTDKTILPKKPTATSELKIDGLDAILLAMAFMLASPPPKNLKNWRI